VRAVLRTRSETGQAAIETVAAVPLVLLAAAVAWQLALTGHTLWLCAHAARAAARAELVGRSPERAARSALPQSLRRDLSVRRVGTGGVRVELRLPLLLRAWRSPVEVAAVSSLGSR
jgi:pilus assembly protein CpaE